MDYTFWAFVTVSAMVAFWLIFRNIGSRTQPQPAAHPTCAIELSQRIAREERAARYADAPYAPYNHEQIMGEIAAARMDALAGYVNGNPYTTTVKTSNGALYHSAEELQGALIRAKLAHERFEQRTGQPDREWQFWYATFLLAEQNPEHEPLARWMRENNPSPAQQWLEKAEAVKPSAVETGVYRQPSFEQVADPFEALSRKASSFTPYRPCWRHPEECDTRPLMD